MKGMIKVCFELERPIHAYLDGEQFCQARRDVMGAVFYVEPYAALDPRWLRRELEHFLGSGLRRVEYAAEWLLTVTVEGHCGPLKTITRANVSPRLTRRILDKWVEHISSWRAFQEQITTGSDFTGNQADAIA